MFIRRRTLSNVDHEEEEGSERVLRTGSNSAGEQHEADVESCHHGGVVAV